MSVLAGLRIIEIAGIGPGPACGMMLADMGAEVILVERKTANANAAAVASPGKMSRAAIFNRGKKSIELDLKAPESIEALLKLIGTADGLIEGFRPGVMERLGLGPDICLSRNPKLVFGRMTGWGQTGPLSKAAGHDLNYIALTGALYYSGHPSEAPFAPPTLVGDMGGGAMVLALGMVGALFSASKTGQGQVVDAAITDGSALLTTLMMSFHQAGLWSNMRGENMIDGGSPWYDTYECADGGYVTVGSLEPKFYALLIKTLELEGDDDFASQYDKSKWASGKAKLNNMFKTKTRDEWCFLMEGTDICFAPVLNFDEAGAHPHNVARETFVEIDGIRQPAPAPRFSKTPSVIKSPPPIAGADSHIILSDLGYSPADIGRLFEGNSQ